MSVWSDISGWMGTTTPPYQVGSASNPLDTSSITGIPNEPLLDVSSITQTEAQAARPDYQLGSSANPLDTSGIDLEGSKDDFSKINLAGLDGLGAMRVNRQQPMLAPPRLRGAGPAPTGLMGAYAGGMAENVQPIASGMGLLSMPRRRV